jgi:hypothetical protein
VLLRRQRDAPEDPEACRLPPGPLDVAGCEARVSDGTYLLIADDAEASRRPSRG